MQAAPGSEQAPPFHASRVLLVVTGALGASFMPVWLNWLRLSYPAIAFRMVLTYSAEKMVSRTALTALTGGEIFQDCWPAEPEAVARHVQLASWPDAVIVYPTSFHYLARVALGTADTPSVLAIQCTSAAVAIAPALPPGGEQSPGFHRHLSLLEAYPNIVVVPPQLGFSAATGRLDAPTAAPFPAVIDALERRRARLAR
ncbi:MAG TPA: flavoprotein [Jatrophihabitantaceae bacterium]|jgi:hypothetical protein|nr:flavoprotein [Jatrophihabitantaceae bacterium]